MILKVTTELVRATQLGVGDANRQVCTLGEEGVRLCRSLAPLAELMILGVRKLIEE